MQELPGANLFGYIASITTLVSAAAGGAGAWVAWYRTKRYYENIKKEEISDLKRDVETWKLRCAKDRSDTERIKKIAETRIITNVLKSARQALDQEDFQKHYSILETWYEYERDELSALFSEMAEWWIVAAASDANDSHLLTADSFADLALTLAPHSEAARRMKAEVMLVKAMIADANSNWNKADDSYGEAFKYFHGNMPDGQGTVVAILIRRGDILQASSAPRLARAMYSQAISIGKQEFGENGLLLAQARRGLAISLGELGFLTEERKELETALDAVTSAENGGESHPLALSIRGDMAFSLRQTDPAESERRLDKIVKEMQTRPDFGPLHMRTLELRHHHAVMLSKIEKYEQAEDALSSLIQELHGADTKFSEHELLPRAQLDLGNLFLRLGKRRESLEQIRKSYEALDKHPFYGSNHIKTLQARRDYGYTLAAISGDFAPALLEIRESLDAFRGHYSFGPNHPETHMTLFYYAKTLFEAGNLKEAKSSLDEFLSRLEGEKAIETPPEMREEALRMYSVINQKIENPTVIC